MMDENKILTLLYNDACERKMWELAKVYYDALFRMEMQKKYGGVNHYGRRLA